MGQGYASRRGNETDGSMDRNNYEKEYNRRQIYGWMVRRKEL